MNTLAYVLLSLLSRDSLSGYDLMLKVQPFWQAKHSQIYPLLAKLEQGNYVQHDLIQQKDKPDKKVYTITAKGLDALKSWLSQPTAEPVTRDEMLMKVYTIWLSDHATARHLFDERIAAYRKRLQQLEGLRDRWDEKFEDDTAEVDILSPDFSRYILIRRAVEIIKSDIEWCQWVMGLVEKSEARSRQQKQDTVMASGEE